MASGDTAFVGIDTPNLFSTVVMMAFMRVSGVGVCYWPACRWEGVLRSLPMLVLLVIVN